MKKTIIFLVVLLLILASMPIVGKKIIEETLDKKIHRLETKGIEILKQDKDEGYLNTSRHYEFLNKGIKYGADLQYSNIPFTEAVSLTLYPLTASDEILYDLRNKDEGFAKYIENFLLNKGLLYHINYNLISGDFDGYLKDIDEEYTMKNNSLLKVKVLGTTFNGNGDLRSPSDVKILSKEINLKISDTRDIMALDIANIHLDAKSLYSERKAQLKSHFYFDTFHLKSNNEELNASMFNYDVNITNIDKQAYKEFISSKQTKASLLKLLSKGLDISIGDLSLKNATSNNENLEGFKISSELMLQADKNLGFKMAISPLLALSNVEVDFKSKISKKLLAEVIKNSSFPNTFIKYQTSSGDDVVFNFSYEQGKLIVNGKTILG